MRIIRTGKEIKIYIFENVLCLNEQLAIEFMVKLLRADSEIKNLNSKATMMQILKPDFCMAKVDVKLIENRIIVDSFYGKKDFEICEFESICNDIVWFLAQNYNVGDFDLLKIDAMYLEQILGIDLPFIVSAKIEMIQMEDLRNFSVENPCGIPLIEGRYYKQISTDSYINYPNHINNFIGQTNEERTRTVLETMKESNYAKNGKYIILYNDSNVIRDGEHRAAALYHLYGNIEIPVLRIKFSHNYYSYKLFYSKGR